MPETVNVATTSPGPIAATLLVPGATETLPSAALGNLKTTIPEPPVFCAPPPFPVLAVPAGPAPGSP